MKRIAMVCLAMLAFSTAAQAPIPVIKVEDALALSKIETRILSNANQRQQLEIIAKQNAEEKTKLEAEFAKAQSDALDHAGADKKKYTIDPDKLAIIEKK